MALMRFVSWTVNGFRAVSKKEDWAWFARTQADVVGLQETKASPDQIPLEIAEERAAKLMDIQKNIMKRSQRKKIGSSMRLLIDQIDDGVAYARGASDAPDIDNIVMLNAQRTMKSGTFINAKIIKAAGSDLIAEKTGK